MPGRPRKPIEQRLLEGTFRKDRHGSPTVTVPGGDAVTKPDGLGEHGSALWDLVVGRIPLKDSDAPQLHLACEWLDLVWVSLALLKRAKPATRRARALRQEAVDYQKRFDSIASRFGLTPSERAKLGVPAERPKGVASRLRVAGG